MQRIYEVLEQVEDLTSSKLLALWNEVMDEMYGEDFARKKAISDMILNDNNVSQKAKEWLKTILISYHVSTYKIGY